MSKRRSPHFEPVLNNAKTMLTRNSKVNIAVRRPK